MTFYVSLGKLVELRTDGCFFMKMLNLYKEYNYLIYSIVKLEHWKEIFYFRKRQFMAKCVVLFLCVTRCDFIGCYFIWITFNWILLFLWNQINVPLNWIWKPTVCWFLLCTSCGSDHELLHVVLRVANKVKSFCYDCFEILALITVQYIDRWLNVQRNIILYWLVFQPFKPRIKSHMLFAGIIRSSPFSPR